MKALSKTTFNILIIIALLFSCTFRSVKVTRTNFTEEIQTQQDLVFSFNFPLMPDSLVNRWDTTEYMIFDPPVEGRFKWLAADEVLFSPLSLFQPCTEYTARISENIFSHTTEKATISSEKIEFHTPFQKLEGADAFWALDESEEGREEIRIILHFTYPVMPDQLQNQLKISIKGSEIPFIFRTQNASRDIELKLRSEGIALTEAITARISILPGLPCEGSTWKSDKEMELTKEIPAIDQLQVMEMLPMFEEGSGIIMIKTTQPLAGKDPKSLIAVDPAVRFEVSSIDNGLKIKGDFEEGKSYTITVSGKTRSSFGVEMGQDYSQVVAFGQVEPYLSFTDKNSIYLSSRGERNLNITVVNIPRIRISIFRIFENNIMHYLRTGKEWTWMYDDNQYHDFYDYPMDENYGKMVGSKEIDVASLPGKGNKRLLNITLDEIGYSGQWKGIYLIKVESTDKRWLRDVALLSLSDLGLIVKEGEKNILVFVNSIKDATPVAGATVRFVSSNNQLVHTATTDSKGVATLTDKNSLIPGFSIGMITVLLENDFNYIFLNQSTVETSRFDVGGKRTENRIYDVYIYGYRDLYRPGDTAYFNTLIRKMDWTAEGEIPVKIKVYYPNGKEFLSFKKMLDKQGAAESSIPLAAEIMTGQYLIEVYSANDVLIGTSRFRVEEFMPDRIRVTAITDKKEYKSEESVVLQVNAMNLFGTPAANRNYEIEMQLSRRDLILKKYPDYDFGINLSGDLNLKSDFREGVTDAEGNATEKFTIDDYGRIGILQGKLFANVFDETGRPVNRLSTFDLYTQKVFYGIRQFDYWIDTRKPLEIGFIAVDKDGNLIDKAKSFVQVIYYQWETVLERSGNRYYYRSQKRETVVYSQDLAVTGELTTITFTPELSGRYEVRIMAAPGESYVARYFYAYGWGDTDYASFEVNKEGEVEIELDKEFYQPGDRVKALFKAPFDGTLLVTVEREDVKDYYYVPLTNKSASHTFRVEEAYLPNVYVTATAIKKSAVSDLPLTVAHGFAPVIVKQPSRKLDLQINAEEKSRSKTSQTVKVSTQPGAEITIALVDEGILQITGFKTPDPYEYFYQKRALEVDAYDLYAQLFPEYKSNLSSVAGGEGLDLSRRVNPLTNKRIKLVSFWSGILQADHKGECSFTVRIPQFSGSLRIMAVAYDGKRFASSDKNMTVADPLVLSTALPRFLSPEDQALVPVTLSNTTGKSASAKVSLEVKGPLTQLEPQVKMIDMPANGEGQVIFRIKADQGIGIGQVKVEAEALNEKFTDETEISIRPAAGLTRISDAGVIKGGESISFTVHSDFIPGSSTSKLFISKSPLTEFSENISYLLRYPYGCVEQTISTAFPLLYFTDLAKALGQDSKTGYLTPGYLVKEAIHKVESMQQYNGALLFWQGGDQVSWWGTAYGAHFLHEARQAGYEVNEQVLQKMITYLQNKARDKETDEYFFRDENGNKTSIRYARREIFYSLFVLSMEGKKNLSLMNYYKSRPELLTTDSKYLLACAYKMMGDQKSYEQILPGSFGDDRSIRSFGGCFYSYLRDISLSLYTLLITDPGNKQIPVLVQAVSKELKNRSWYSTQETAFSLLALGKFSKMNAQGNVKAEIKIENAAVAGFSGRDVVLDEDIQNKKVTINTSDEGNLYYFYEVDGISASGKVMEEDSYLEVRKSFYNRYGQPLTQMRFMPNDLVVVKVSVRSMLMDNVENVAVTDILPACFEIENPRLTPERELSWIKERSTPEYMDIREDRITFFTNARREWKHFYHMVRVVSRGTYKMGPVSADAMYDGQYHSYWGAGEVSVE